MGVDQDLSGSMVKVVQYAIVSVATNIKDNARVLHGPEMIAFGDDMTAADFTAWILSECRERICHSVREKNLGKDRESILLNPKWHRVAFQVISRFAPVDIDWNEAQALYLGQIAHHTKPPVSVKVADQSVNVTIDEEPTRHVEVKDDEENRSAR